MGFSRQEYSFPSPGDLPNPGIEHRSPALQADSSPTELPGIFHAKSKTGGAGVETPETGEGQTFADDTGV